jgi:hypothetical protein
MHHQSGFAGARPRSDDDRRITGPGGEECRREDRIGLT